MNKAIFNWSGGKDSALALYRILRQKEFDVSCLLTSVNRQFQRISMHGVRVELLHKQAESIGIPLVKLELDEMPDMESYDREVGKMMTELKKTGATHSIFGDIFLEDLRKYREEKLDAAGWKGVFPLWKEPTDRLIREFLDLGFKTITTCVNEKYLDKSFVGRVIDEQFLKDLPVNVDPCGENGEFHTFVYDGPIFKKPIEFSTGEIVHRKYERPKSGKDDCFVNEDDTSTSLSERDDPYYWGFYYCDLAGMEK